MGLLRRWTLATTAVSCWARAASNTRSTTIMPVRWLADGPYEVLRPLRADFDEARSREILVEGQGLAQPPLAHHLETGGIDE